MKTPKHNVSTYLNNELSHPKYAREKQLRGNFVIVCEDSLRDEDMMRWPVGTSRTAGAVAVSSVVYDASLPNSRDVNGV